MLPHFTLTVASAGEHTPMVARESKTEFEKLRTEVEELNNSLSRILDILNDNNLSEAERIERAITIAEMAKSTEKQYR